MATQASTKKIALNIYLLKAKQVNANQENWEEKDFIAKSTNSSGKSRQIGTDKHPLGPAGAFGTLYVRRPASEVAPEWLQFVRPSLAVPTSLDRLKNKSVSALLVVKSGSRQFALAFGHGRHMLDTKCIEDRFGIRVVLNSISPDKIASIDKQTFDAAPRISRTQAIKATSLSDYEISAEQDLLRALVGLTKTEYSAQLGQVLAGMDSLKTSISIDIGDLGKLLEKALERSQSKDYLATDSTGKRSEFAWVDNLKSVTDRAQIEALEKALWKKFWDRDFSAMWLAIPEIVDWVDITGFGYDKKEIEGDEPLDSFLNIERLRESLRSNATLDTLRNKNIFMVLSTGAPPRSFTALKCIYAEVSDATGLSVLHGGTWYHVEPSFLTEVQDYFTHLKRRPFVAPFMEYAHVGEGSYNEAVWKVDKKTCAMLDRKLIQYGAKHGKIEVCDLYFPNPAGGVGGQFIHVKRGRSSATLSHLFAQGSVSSALLVREELFVVEVNKQLLTQKMVALPTKFSSTGSEIVYAIIDGPAGGSLDLPFFSKVNLQNCGKTISAYGFDVSLMHIPESAAYLTSKAAHKATKKAAKGALIKPKASTKKVAAKKRATKV